MILVPAYGRDYKSKEEVQKAWDEGKDFLIQDVSSPYDGKYINKNNDSDEEFKVRYNKKTKVVTLK